MPPSPFHNITPDCIGAIMGYHIFHIRHGMDKNPRDYDDDPANTKKKTIFDVKSEGMGGANWKFLSKFAHCCDFRGDEGLGEFISSCRDWTHKPTFSYLRLPRCKFSTLFKNGTVEYLRGISELHLSITRQGHDEDEDPADRQQQDDCLDSLFRNIRGVKKLSLTLGLQYHLTDQHLENLRGIQEAFLSSCNFIQVPQSALSNFRGIQRLHLRNCAFQGKVRLLQELSGIKELTIDFCMGISLSAEEFKFVRGIQKLSLNMLNYEEFALTNQHMPHLRGIQELNLYMPPDDEVDFDYDSMELLQDKSFENLRGIRKLELIRSPSFLEITDFAFVNLRGVLDITLHGFTGITSSIMENFRNVEKLAICDCPNMDFDAEYLYNLRGSVQDLQWDSIETRDKKLLESDSLKCLYGIETLHLHHVVPVSDEAFQHLSQSKSLVLYGRLEEEDLVPLSDVAFSHLKMASYLSLSNMNLRNVKCFQNMVENHPNLKILSIDDCMVSRDAIKMLLPEKEEEESDDESMDSDSDWCMASFSFRNGKWMKRLERT